MKNVLRFGLLMPLLVLTLIVAGCGDDGKDGRNGAPGAPGVDGADGAPGTDGADGADGADGQDAFSLAFSENHAAPQVIGSEIVGVTVNENGTITVNFTVAGITDAVNAEYTIAKWLPAENSWISMMQRNRTYNADATEVIRGSNLRPGSISAVDGVFSYTFNSGGADIDFSQGAYWTHSKPAVADNAYGDYVQGILDAIETNGAWDPAATYRIGVTSRQNERFTAVAYVDGSGNPVASPPLDNALVSCTDCHSGNDGYLYMPAHGNRRNDAQLCTTCHNNFTYDSYNSSATVGGWAPVDAMTMTHKIHAGIEGYTVAGASYEDVRFPDWTFGRGNGPQNCTACHKGDVPTAGQGWNRGDASVAGACATCHVSGGVVFDVAGRPHAGDCVACHGGSFINGFPQTADTYHGVSEAVDALATARSYLMEIVAVENAVAGQAAQVTWRVAKDGVYQDLFAGTDTYLEDAVRLGIGWGVGEDWTNDDSGVSSNGDAGRPLQVTANAGNTVAGADLTYAVTTFPILPAAATAERNGFAVVERGPAGINVSSALKTITLGSGSSELGDRREIVSSESCLACHNTIGRHGTTADVASGVTSCVTCHNAGSLSRASSVVQGTVDFMYIMHAIHGVGEKRDKFERRYDHGYDYVTYPNTILDCGACHIGGSENFPVDSTRRIGVFADSLIGTTAENSPMGSVCYSCHQNTEDQMANRELQGHINAFGGDMLGNAWFEEYVDGSRVESCTFCHKP